MNFMKKRFKTQREAVLWYGHSWWWICNHYRVQYCYSFTNGFQGYFIDESCFEYWAQ